MLRFPTWPASSWQIAVLSTTLIRGLEPDSCVLFCPLRDSRFPCRADRDGLACGVFIPCPRACPRRKGGLEYAVRSYIA